jgi:hypothetical protein
VVLIVGWVGVSGHGYPAQELPYIISGGLGGVFLLGIGATLWLSADLRDEWGKLNRIERRLAAIDEALGGVRAGTGSSDGPSGADPAPPMEPAPGASSTLPTA